MATETPLADFGRKAADFDLPAVDGRRYRLADIRGVNGLLVMFICNHCPYVRAVVDDLVKDCAILAGDGIGVIAIMSNDTVAYPEDSFANMRDFAASHRFPFPYAIDESQEVARAYGAVCTPDFFGYDKNLALRYRGRLVETVGKTPKAGARRDLLEAMREIVRTGQGPKDQTSSIGCSIKWRLE
jgi:peroxiredoxin